MIALVVVSHSRSLAEAAVELAAEMVDGAGPHIAIAAGVETGTGTPGTDGAALGTDAATVAETLTVAAEASGGDGVLVLLDLGSAVLSAEMALELVDPQVSAQVRLSPAPLVEGLVAAVVAAAAGADLDTCDVEARRGAHGKAEHLGADADVSLGPDLAGATGAAAGQPTHQVELAVLGEHGLHARPAARLVACAAEVAPGTTVHVRNVTSGRGPVDALSLSGVATLDAQQGHVLVAEASGPQAESVLAALVELAARGFGDLPGPAEPLSEAEILAPAVSTEPGIAGTGLEAAMGPVVRLAVVPDPREVEAVDRETEAASLRDAVEVARGRLAELADHAARHLGEGEAEVFAAEAALLDDPEIAHGAAEAIRAGASAAAAWHAAITTAAEQFEELTSSYQRERALDVRSVGDRVLRLLLGVDEPEVVEEGVLVVDELDPALALALDATRVTGVITRHGGSTGHGVLVASSRGIPVYTGAGERVDVPDGTLVAFDARSGRLAVDPDPDARAVFEAIVRGRRAEREAALHNAHLPAVTTDRVRVRVTSNVSSLAVARLGAGLGADGAGLVRTESVFARWRQAPSVQQQMEVYAALADVFAPHEVTIRTWDAGADKPLSFVPGADEGFLGARGLRAFDQDPALLVDQLEAICRVAVDRRLKVIFPMVTTVQDVTTACVLLERAAGRAGLDGPPPGLSVGIMVEVPAAALRVGQLAEGLDLVSIGTNDLIQYAMAAERGRPYLAKWSDRLEPAVLHLVRTVCADAPPGVQVSLCGAMAADPDLAGLLVGLGVHELSATPVAVPMVKERLRRGSSHEFRDLADRALALPDAAAVRALLDESLPAVGVPLSAPRVGGTGR